MNEDNFSMSWEQAVQWLRQQPDKAQLVVDCYYDDPLLAAAQRYWASDEWHAVRQILAGCSGSALDAGAGRGIASYALARDGFSVTALEPNPSALVGAAAIRGMAADGGVTINVCEEFSERLPFESSIFDIVFARAVLHHTSDLKSACAEFCRVLKPGGIMLALREHVISDRADLPAFCDIHPLHKLYGGENAFLLSDYKVAILEAGFTNLQIISPWHSVMNFAPHTPATLQHAVASKLGGVAPLVRGLFKLPGIWSLMCAFLAITDRRPGRLYSFVASKPTS